MVGLFKAHPGDHRDWNRVIERKSCPRGCCKGHKDHSYTRSLRLEIKPLVFTERDEKSLDICKGMTANLNIYKVIWLFYEKKKQTKKTDYMQARVEARRPVRRLVAITQVRGPGGWTTMGAGRLG